MNPSALVRWFLTAYERAAITRAFKGMSACSQSEKQPKHKEFGASRKKRDEADVQSIIRVLKTIAKDPFETEQQAKDSSLESQPPEQQNENSEEPEQSDQQDQENSDTVTQDSEEGEEQLKFEYPLINIITGFVASEEATQNFFKSHVLGRKEMLKFVNSRLINKEVGFFLNIDETATKNFSSIQKPLKVTVKSKENSIVADRDLLAKIVIIANSRKLDLF